MKDNHVNQEVRRPARSIFHDRASERGLVAERGSLRRQLELARPQLEQSFVDGIGSKTVFPQMLEIAIKLLDGAIAASLDEVASVMRLMAVRSRIVSEGARAVAAACAIAGRARHGRIACIVSGGNIDLDKFCTIMSRGKAPDQ